MSLEEPSFFDKLKTRLELLVPLNLRLKGMDDDGLSSERRKLASVVLLRAREGKNRSADLKKLRMLDEELQKRNTARAPLAKSSFPKANN